MSYFFDANFLNAKDCKNYTFWNINVSDFSSYLQSYLTYRSVTYIKSKLKTFYFDLIFSDIWLKSILYEIGSNEFVSFFFFDPVRLLGRLEYSPHMENFHMERSLKHRWNNKLRKISKDILSFLHVCPLSSLVTNWNL